MFDFGIFILKTKSGCHHDLKTPTLNLKLIIDDILVELFLLVFVCLLVCLFVCPFMYWLSKLHVVDAAAFL